MKTILLELGVISSFSTFFSSLATSLFPNNAMLISSLGAGVGAIIGFLVLKFIKKLTFSKATYNGIISFCLILLVPFLLYFIAFDFLYLRYQSYINYASKLAASDKFEQFYLKLSLRVTFFAIVTIPCSLLLEIFSFKEAWNVNYELENRSLNNILNCISVVATVFIWTFAAGTIIGFINWSFGLSSVVGIIAVFIIGSLLSSLLAYLFVVWFIGTIILLLKIIIKKILTTTFT